MAELFQYTEIPYLLTEKDRYTLIEQSAFLIYSNRAVYIYYGNNQYTWFVIRYCEYTLIKHSNFYNASVNGTYSYDTWA